MVAEPCVGSYGGSKVFPTGVVPGGNKGADR